MLKNNVIVVTGGAGLIGSSFIEEIINNNGIAIIADINKKIGKKICKDLRNKYKTNNIEFIKLDITSKKSITKLLKKIDNKYGRIDSLVNNAYPRNKSYGKHFFDVSYKNFSKNISLNLGGYFLMSQQFSKYFKKHNYGNIINIASIYGVIAPKFDIYNNTNMTVPVEYAAIKSALIHLTKYMSKYFKGDNIRVNTISPGGILQGQDKLFIKKYNNSCLNKGMLNPNDLNGTLIYLLSDMSKFVNGQNIIVDDGFCL